ncbi:hypothetical protein [Actinoplanes subglobosus]|uniref:Uncharacterized protein n=1 Tax=Actinoplanes subglobosus TaxID=1547892 RepID=A0ABV8IV96_9ACTN
MSLRALHAELAVVRALAADGLAEIGDAGGTGQVWLRTAAARLTAFDGVLAEAAGVLAAPVQVLVLTVVTFLVVAGSAALAGTLGLSGGGILTAAGAALLLAAAAVPFATRRLYTLIGRRRTAATSGTTNATGIAAVTTGTTNATAAVTTGTTTATGTGTTTGTGTFTATAIAADASGTAVTVHFRHPSPGRPAHPASGRVPAQGWVPAQGRVPAPGRVGNGEAGLAGVPDRLMRARVRLVSAALRHVGTAGWDTPQLRRAIRTDPMVRRLAHADQLLCQAVDCIERHLGDLRKDAL